LFVNSAYEVIVPARGKALIKTDLAIAVPEDCYGRIGIDLAWRSV
jgi:dUTP pyrophosphatase